MSIQIVRPARSVQGSLVVPGDKSISHRYAMLAGLAEGTTRLTNFSTGADPHSTLGCMQALGATVTHTGEGRSSVIEITGTAGAFQQPTRLRHLRLPHAHALRADRAAPRHLPPDRRPPPAPAPHGAHPQAARPD